MKLNTQISFFIFAIITILSITAYGQQKADKKLLIGRWVSKDDKKYTIVVTNKTFVEYYGKEKVGVFTYSINKDKLIKTDKGDGEVYEYDVETLTKKDLVIIYLSRGNMLHFVRRK